MKPRKRSSMDYPEPVSVNRWYLDGYRARLNGKPLYVNPKGRLWDRRGVKAERWERGWWDADTAINRMTQWDREQEIIDALQET